MPSYVLGLVMLMLMLVLVLVLVLLAMVLVLVLRINKRTGTKCCILIFTRALITFHISVIKSEQVFHLRRHHRMFEGVFVQ